jgi:peptide/nickel transport system substrate-binding protein
MTRSRSMSDPIRVTSEAELRSLMDRRSLIKVAGAGAAAGVLGVSTAAAAPSSRSASSLAAQDDGLEIIIGTLGEASTINPFLAGDSEDEWRCKILYDEFVRVDPVSYAPLPGIAAEWTVEDLVVTFTLQPNVTFSDGTPLTANDIAFTIKGMLNPATGSQKQSKFMAIAGAAEFIDGTADDVSGIVVVDDATIQITLAQPEAPFLFNMRYVWPVPAAALEGQDLANAEFFQAPIGAGPFVFESWTTGADFVATANPTFWENPKPAITRVTHRVLADSQTLVLALQNNEIDGSNYPNPAGKDILAENTALDLITPPFLSPNGWFFNCRHEVLGIKEVRKAIAMALNTEQFAADALLGLGKAGLGPIGPGSWAFDPTLEPIPYDVAGAKALIDAAGVSGAQITFAVNSGNVLREDWLTYTQQALQEIGIEVIPELVDYAEHVTAVTLNQDFEVSGVDFAGVTSEPSGLWDNFHSTSSGNYSGFSNPELDELLDQARATLETEDAIPLYAQIQRIIMDEVPMHCAWYRPFLQAVNKEKFAGYVSSADFGLFYFLQDWTGASA